MITKGKVITKDILASGKIISNENCLREGELIGNFFNISSNSNLKLPEIDIEVEALEETTLEEFKFSKKEISYENFNISKSQFYLIYSKLKKEKYVTEDKNIIKLDIEKINEYLNHLELDGYSRKD